MCVVGLTYIKLDDMVQSLHHFNSCVLYNWVAVLEEGRIKGEGVSESASVCAYASQGGREGGREQEQLFNAPKVILHVT